MNSDGKIEEGVTMSGRHQGRRGAGAVSIAVGELAVLVPLTAAAQTAGKANKQVTFAEDVAPILQEKCQRCHHPGTVAPMSLMTYEETRPWVSAIKRGVAS